MFACQNLHAFHKAGLKYIRARLHICHKQENLLCLHQAFIQSDKIKDPLFSFCSL
jgi:hypothetical protein